MLHRFDPPTQSTILLYTSSSTGTGMAMYMGVLQVCRLVPTARSSKK